VFGVRLAFRLVRKSRQRAAEAQSIFGKSERARLPEEALASEGEGSKEGSVSRFWDCFAPVLVLFRFWNGSVSGTVPIAALYTFTCFVAPVRSPVSVM
jgi:hypothetical protein